MATLRLIVVGICLSLLWLWHPSGSGAVSTSLLCQGVGDGMWSQWGKGALPQNDDTINKAGQIGKDCPSLDPSMRMIVDRIKGHQRKQDDAKKGLDKYNKHLDNYKSQSPAYDPSGMPGRS
jgi:hypothetical protein